MKLRTAIAFAVLLGLVFAVGAIWGMLRPRPVVIKEVEVTVVVTATPQGELDLAPPWPTSTPTLEPIGVPEIDLSTSTPTRQPTSTAVPSTVAPRPPAPTVTFEVWGQVGDPCGEGHPLCAEGLTCAEAHGGNPRVCWDPAFNQPATPKPTRRPTLEAPPDQR